VSDVERIYCIRYFNIMNRQRRKEKGKEKEQKEKTHTWDKQ
jgi:hypothetical protein